MASCLDILPVHGPAGGKRDMGTPDHAALTARTTVNGSMMKVCLLDFNISGFSTRRTPGLLVMEMSTFGPYLITPAGE